MRVLVSGASGFVGAALVERLGREGHRLARLVRRQPQAGQSEIRWDPAAGELDRSALEGFDAVIHLAGESIATGRWTAARKERILTSRVSGTELLAEALARLSRRPGVLVSASAVGFYGDRGDEELDESSPPGVGFLPDVCRRWEAAAAQAAEGGIRVVSLRLGMVLSAKGGALAQMLPVFRLGLGGPLGSGRQYMSWIALDDVLGAILHVLATHSLQGPVNAVAPEPVTNRDFARALGRVLGRPTWLPAPAFALRILLGPMADELLLASARVMPRRLVQTGYEFAHPNLDGTLRALFGRR